MGSRIKVPAETDGNFKEFNSDYSEGWAQTYRQVTNVRYLGLKTAGSQYHPWAYRRKGIRVSRALWTQTGGGAIHVGSRESR